MAFSSLKDYNLSFPTFRYPDLTNVFSMVADAYKSDRRGENMAAGIGAAGKAIAGIPAAIQTSQLNDAKVANLNAETGVLTNIANAKPGIPVGHINGWQDPLPEASSPTSTGAPAGLASTPVDIPVADITPAPLASVSPIPGNTRLSPDASYNTRPLAGIAPDFTNYNDPVIYDSDPRILAGTNPATPIATPTVSAGPTEADVADILGGAALPNPVAKPRGTALAQTNSTPPVDPNIIKAPLAAVAPPKLGTIQPGGPGTTFYKTIDGKPISAVEPVIDPKTGVKMPKERALHPAEEKALGGALPEKEIPAGIQSDMLKAGIDYRHPDALNQFLAYNKNKTEVPKLDRGLQKEVNSLNITTAGKTADQVRAEVNAALVEQGRLSEPQITHINSLTSKYMREAPYTKWVSVTDGYHNAKEAAKSDSGIANKLLIEEGQRVLNPTVGVAASTMKSFGASAGLIEKLSPDYIAKHFERGAFLTADQKKEYLHVLDEALKNRDKEMDKTQDNYMKMAKAAGIPESLAPLYFNNPYDQAATHSATAGAVDHNAALEWLAANPNDPNAAAVKAKLQAAGIAVP